MTTSTLGSLHVRLDLEGEPGLIASKSRERLLSGAGKPDFGISQMPWVGGASTVSSVKQSG